MHPSISINTLSLKPAGLGAQIDAVACLGVRGISPELDQVIAFGISELSVQPNLMNEREGNAAAFSYGIVKGVGRFLARFGFGIYDTLTFPFPTTRGSYKQPYPSNIPWIHGGMEEFPPELGWETRYHYVRCVYSYP